VRAGYVILSRRAKRSSPFQDPPLLQGLPFSSPLKQLAA